MGTFLARQLPTRFAVATGEVVDEYGSRTGQIDLLIYDESVTRPLRTFDDGSVLLAAEALLATIEVKSVLDHKEVGLALQGTKKIHDLFAWRWPWLAPRQGDDTDDGWRARVFTSVFGFQTDLVAGDDWGKRETERVRRRAIDVGCPMEHLDRFVVLDRGMLLPAPGVAARPREASGVLGIWFFSLVNFLDRESARRRDFPWPRYQPDAEWTSVATALHDAPASPPRKRAKPSRTPEPTDQAD